MTEWLTHTHTHTHTHTLHLSGKWVKSYQPNSEIRSVIKACGGHLFFHYLEKAHLNLLSGDTDWEKEHIFSHVRKPGVIEHPHLEMMRQKNHCEIQTVHELFLKCRLCEKEPKATESIIHNHVLLVWMCWTECPCGWITEMIHWKEGCTVSQRQTGRKATFVELPLALKVLTNSKVSIWT